MENFTIRNPAVLPRDIGALTVHDPSITEIGTGPSILDSSKKYHRSNGVITPENVTTTPSSLQDSTTNACDMANQDAENSDSLDSNSTDENSKKVDIDTSKQHLTASSKHIAAVAISSVLFGILTGGVGAIFALAYVNSICLSLHNNPLNGKSLPGKDKSEEEKDENKTKSDLTDDLTANDDLNKVVETTKAPLQTDTDKKSKVGDDYDYEFDELNSEYKLSTKKYDKLLQQLDSLELPFTKI